MLEEFFHDRSVLALFARHYQTGEAIPVDLVARMNAADAFGRARAAQVQLMYPSRPPSWSAISSAGTRM